MRSHLVGRRNIWILLCCIGVGWVLWYFWGPCSIIPIKDTLVVRYDRRMKTWKVMDKYIVVRPPGNLFKLREVFSDYDKKYPLDIELTNQKIKKLQAQKIGNVSDSAIEYTRLFYKNTSDTPLEWNGKRDENKEGMEADHRQDLIGFISWMKNDPVKEFSTTKRLDWNLYQTITFYKDGRTKFREYVWGGESKEYYLDNWY